jgi:hypothetical protein
MILGKLHFQLLCQKFDGLIILNIKTTIKISQIVTVSGLGLFGYNNNFVLYPKFSIYESNNVEGGMQSITVNNADLSLFINKLTII